MSDRPGFIRRMLGGFWRGVTRLRVAMSNILFLLVLVLLIAVFYDSAPQSQPKVAALLLNPVGTIVEQKTYIDPFTVLFGEEVPSEQEVLLADVLEAIEIARDDPAITALVMELEQLYGVGMSKNEDIAQALAGFRSSGKSVIAWGDFFSQSQYYLAAQADEIILHPMGAIQIEGFGRYQWYFKEALEKLNVTANVFRAGKYKSAVEPLTRSSMSLEEQEASGRWLQQLWARYTDSIERERELDAGSITRFANQYADLLVQNAGGSAQMAADLGLVDRLENRGPANRYIADKVGATDEEGGYQAVGFEQYLSLKKSGLDDDLNEDAVGVIVANGTIYDGEQPTGSVGGNSLGRLIAEAADDDSIKSIVLRVDSGGGSAFASEVIRQKVLYAKQQGKPVVVSMGSLAASGGYWIAADASEIWASATTLTGSIGVFGVYPTVDGALNNLGIQVDGVGTTELAGRLRSDRPLDTRVANILQAGVDSIYSKFITLVADGRGMQTEEVDKIAGGRVWSGIDALELGLVDKLGNLDEAIASAADLAGLESFRVKPVELPLDPQEAFWRQLSESIGLRIDSTAMLPEGIKRVLAPLASGAKILTEMNDPMGVYARCETCTGH